MLTLNELVLNFPLYGLQAYSGYRDDQLTQNIMAERQTDPNDGGSELEINKMARITEIYSVQIFPIFRFAI